MGKHQQQGVRTGTGLLQAIERELGALAHVELTHINFRLHDLPLQGLVTTAVVRCGWIFA